MPAPVRLRPPRVLALLAALLLALPACGFFAPTIAVRRVGPDTVYDELHRNAMSGEEPSSATREVLQTYDLDEAAQDEPLEALRRLHALTLQEPTRRNLFALAELAYHAGRRYQDRDAFLAASIYAWLYLLGDEDPLPPSPWDRRFRWACDLHNASLQYAFSQQRGEYVAFHELERTLPVGRVTVDLDESGTPWDEGEFRSYVPGDDWHISGLTLRLRDAGLGVPLIGIRHDGRPGAAPATAFLRLHGGLADMAGGLRATIELHSAYDATSLQVAGREVPLESDLSVMLAYGLNESPLWKFSLAGLFEGNRAVDENRMLTLVAPQRGRIPVVFVHGTASNPAYWAEMFNTLLGDPDLRSNMQFWFFQYTSGNPILYSALTLREELERMLQTLDPQGSDPALRQVVLVGHSQGGLLVRLLTCDGSLEWFEKNTGRRLEDLDADPQTVDLLRRAFDFRAVPQVTRAIYLATPHRGSFRADSWYARMLARFISLPAQIEGGVRGALTRQRSGVPLQIDGQLIPTSLDNMNPSSLLLARLAETPASPAVTAHSLVCIGDTDPDDPQALAGADDGVVRYESAHIEGVASELLVASQHSCQDKPAVIQEVRRILREHLAAVRAARP